MAKEERKFEANTLAAFELQLRQRPAGSNPEKVKNAPLPTTSLSPLENGLSREIVLRLIEWLKQV